MSKFIRVKASLYKKYIDKVNNKMERFAAEREHLINVYSLEPSLVNSVIDNMLNISKYKEDIEINEDMVPDYNYEKEMMYAYQDFKDELVYDGMFELSNRIRLSDFYLLFSRYYCPVF